MIDQTISRLKDSIENASNLDSKKKAELLGLIEQMKNEMDQVTALDEKGSIANFAYSSTYEAMKESGDKNLLDISLAGLNETVRKYEITHPELVKAVNAVCNFLSNLGI
jgi:hypothetical protein